MSEGIIYEGRIPACGVYCGGCPLYLKKKKACPGASFCERCESCRSYHLCCKERGISHCFLCSSFPCAKFRGFASRWLKYGQDLLLNQQLLNRLGEKGMVRSFSRRRPVILETDRLKILALFPDQFSILCEDYERFEQVMGLQSSGYPMFWTEDIRQVMSQLCDQAWDHAENYQWYTNWLIVLKEENIAVGSACFKGAPDDLGEVEIGYGIYPAYHNRGYMTEAVAALCKWALTREHVTAVLAATNPDNTPSCRVLEKTGFVRYQGPDECLFWWRYK